MKFRQPNVDRAEHEDGVLHTVAKLKTFDVESASLTRVEAYPVMKVMSQRSTIRK